MEVIQGADWMEITSAMQTVAEQGIGKPTGRRGRKSGGREKRYSRLYIKKGKRRRTWNAKTSTADKDKFICTLMMPYANPMFCGEPN